MARSLTALLPRIGPRSVQRRHAQLPPPELRRARRTRWLIAGVAVGAVLFLVVSVLVAQLGKRDAETETGVIAGERDAASGQAVAASIPVVQLCEEPSAVGEALRADPRNPCQLAQQVVADPVPTVVPRDGRDGPPPTPEQIQTAVRAELALNPPPAGRTPTAGEVAAIVAQFLTANPPAPGRPPTAAEIESAVSAYFAANPVTNGVDGDDGEPGRPPTAEEIQAAVAAELAANPPRMGDRGAQGVGVQEIRAEQRDTGCVLVFVLTNPADGSTTEQAVPVSDRVCQGGGLVG